MGWYRPPWEAGRWGEDMREEGCSPARALWPGLERWGLEECLPPTTDIHPCLPPTSCRPRLTFPQRQHFPSLPKAANSLGLPHRGVGSAVGTLWESSPGAGWDLAATAPSILSMPGASWQEQPPGSSLLCSPSPPQRQVLLSRRLPVYPWDPSKFSWEPILWAPINETALFPVLVSCAHLLNVH